MFNNISPPEMVIRVKLTLHQYEVSGRKDLMTLWQSSDQANQVDLWSCDSLQLYEFDGSLAPMEMRRLNRACAFIVSNHVYCPIMS